MDRLFGILIKQANNAVNRDAEKFAQTLGLTSVQISIIDYISRFEANQDVFQKDVEREFNIRRPTATSALKLMEERDLIICVPIERDARLKKIILTSKATTLAKQINDFFNMSEQRIINLVGVENKDIFRNALKQVINGFSD
ncbi:MarR family winged helix-turn-helix transcriptional regulator [Companilactobacillus nodensis]|uniref:Transcription regulator n=1 Tax=Companilactobacillus nodensis DSM 19682 = JCM 14932 = NBRC 107160 TaxID=1423775 RepID=A0A0R1KK36_9LACO|nr:helix-turn-helix domain-containing protein [Companilactobacillus nodensis]KRK80945.1 transcription regulator [Companilactobacillus nodensis DSM 19682 = JCM 14932 = NBRC 107160]